MADFDTLARIAAEASALADRYGAFQRSLASIAASADAAFQTASRRAVVLQSELAAAAAQPADSAAKEMQIIAVMEAELVALATSAEPRSAELRNLQEAVVGQHRELEPFIKGPAAPASGLPPPAASSSSREGVLP